MDRTYRLRHDGICHTYGCTDPPTSHVLIATYGGSRLARAVCRMHWHTTLEATVYSDGYRHVADHPYRAPGCSHPHGRWDDTSCVVETV